VCAHAVEALQRELTWDLRVLREERRVVRLDDRELELETFGIAEAEAAFVAFELDSLGAETVVPELDRVLRGDAEDDPVHHPAAVGAAEGALVLFHGRGADEDDLFPLLDALDPERRLAAATPRGPLALPPGGAHWYALGGIGTPEPTTFLSSFGAAATWLDGF